jgi:hypothetical protein
MTSFIKVYTDLYPVDGIYSAFYKKASELLQYFNTVDIFLVVQFETHVLTQ